MAEIIFFNNELLTIAIMSFLIFASRIVDVALGTLRFVAISKGNKALAPMLGFFEVIIWLIVVQQVITNLTNPLYYIFYGLGFAAGTYIGIVIEEKYNNGKIVLRIITKRTGYSLEKELSTVGCYVYTLNGVSNFNKEDLPIDIKFLFMIIKKKSLHKVLEKLKKIDPDARYSVEDVRIATDDFPEPHAAARSSFGRFGFLRKGL